MVTTYNYVDPCYNQTELKQNEPICPQPDITTEQGNIGGFREVTATTLDYNSNPLRIQKTLYHHTDMTRYGRPEQIDLMDGNSILLQQTKHLYEVDSFSTQNVQFTFTSETTTEQFNAGNSISSKVEYDYEAGNQGGAQYGNLTNIKEFDDKNAAVAYRTTRRWYDPNTTNWIVNKPRAEGRYESDSWTLLSGTWYYYDSSNNLGDQPVKGFLTQTRQIIEIDCAEITGAGPSCATGYQTIDTTFTLDSGGFGNQATITTYADYGYRGIDSNNVETINIPATGNRTITLTYDADYNLYPVSIKNPLNQETKFAVYGFKNASGTLVGLTGFQTQPGLLKRVIDPNGLQTTYEYDPFGRLYQVYEHGDTQDLNDFDKFDGDPAMRYRYWDNSWNNSGEIWGDPAGNEPFGISVHTRPNVYTSSGPYVMKQMTYYDGFGRPIQDQAYSVEVDGLSSRRTIVTTTDYDVLGQISCVTAPYDVADAQATWPNNNFQTTACTSKDNTTTTYDALGRPLTITAPDNTATNYSYSVMNTITVDSFTELSKVELRDANGQAIRHFSNSRGELVLVRELTETDAGYADTRYTYDLLGNLVTVGTSDVSNAHPPPANFLRTVTITYDNFGRKTSMNDPDMGSWSYEYDAAGNLLRQTDANNDVLCFYYDALDRLEHKIEDSSPATACPTNPPASGTEHLASYTYDPPNAIGQPATVSWGANPTQNYDEFTYDSLGRLTQQDRYLDSNQYSMTTNSFDSLHRPLTITYPNGDSTTLTYDREGEETLTLTSATPAEVLVEGITYNARGQIKYLDRNNAIPNTNPDTWYTYYPASGNFRLEKIQHGSEGTDNRPDFAYEYDDVGNITQLTTTVSSFYGTDVQAFTYDHLNRLTTACTLSGSNCTSAASGDYDHTYTYDKLGNITNFAGTAYTYQDGNHIHAVTHLDGVLTFSYDNNGNMITRIEGGITYTQAFDVENRLTSVTGNGQTTSFSYDASGIRVKTVEPDGTIIYTPFPNYEEEIQPGGQANSGVGGGILAAPLALEASPTTAANNAQSEGILLFTLVTVGGLVLCLPVVALKVWHHPQQRTKLRLAWRRHRLTVGKVISLVSLVGLLTNSFILVPGVWAAPALGPVQSPWVSADIGTVGVAGSADETSGTFTLNGGGNDIGGTVDAFHYVYQPLSGDGEIIANLTALTGGGATPKAGVMIRESLTDDSPHVSALVRGNRIRVYERTTTGGSTNELNGANNGAPEWLRIERTGNTFDLYHSNNGTSWTLMQTRTVTMGTNVYIGMAVTGNSTTTLATGTFDNVSVTGGGGSPTATPTNTPSPTPTSPGPTATPTNTPTPTPPPGGGATIQRVTFMFAGQAIAVKVAGDPTSSNNGIFYFHNDHLGSTSVLTRDSNGYVRGDSVVRYLPFGGYRDSGSQGITDRGFTGHKENLDIGLIYMNARFYVSSIARFASADTIVPNPSNPQSLNRYSYSYNNPVNYSDPSGHIPCDSPNLPGIDQGACEHDTQQEINNNNSYYPSASRVSNAIIGVGKGDLLPDEYAHYDNSGAWETYFRTGIEPIDWYLSGKEVLSGDVGFLEGTQLILITLIFNGGLADEGAGFADNILRGIDPPTSRGGLRRAMGSPPTDMVQPQAHHDLPWTFRDWFAGEGRGLNVNDPQFGRWVEGNPTGTHQSWSRDYQMEWDGFISNNPNANRQDVLEFLDELIHSGRFP